MKLALHPAVRRELRDIIDRYDRLSDQAGDRFIEEVNTAFQRIKADPEHFHFITERFRRCNLKRFPYNVVFEVHGSTIRVAAVRHHSRHPDFGLRRQWR